MQLYSNTLRNWMKWKNFQENTNLPNYVQEKVKNRSINDGSLRVEGLRANKGKLPR